ncbi:MAG: DUF3035 domain-containing protein [Alphaproteobacteria bacterium]
MAAKRSRLTRAAALVAAAALMGAGLSGCGLGRALGISKTSPDEFAVVTKAPLVLPPDYELRPPKPGAKRPQEQEPSEAAKQALFKNKNELGQPGATPTSGEQALLASAGAAKADSDVRQQIEKDNKLLVRKSEDIANKLVFGNESATSASADEDETPTITKTKE